MKFLEQYKNLSREIYVLFFGRVVTSMGSLVWPIMTLILKNKLGYNATTIATITLVMSILQFPMMLLGGKLADTMNRKKIIVCCDMVTVLSYIICGLLPLSGHSIALIYLAGVFATIEGPSYDALVADLSDSESREKAYSLQYLGMNLGLVLSPTLAGFLFENYLGLSFIIEGLATFSSTLLIILFIKQLHVEKEKVSEYEKKRENENIFQILSERKPIIIYALMVGVGGLVYAQFNYLLPLNMEALYGAKGAAIFGMLTSTNALVVILATPVITTFLGKITDVRKILIGEALIIGGLFGYKFIQGIMPLYFLLMVIFTVGEVFNTLGNQPYMTRRMPSTHWGRINSFIYAISGAFSSIGNVLVGKTIDTKGFGSAWVLVGVFGIATIALAVTLNIIDKKHFHLLYEE